MLNIDHECFYLSEYYILILCLIIMLSNNYNSHFLQRRSSHPWQLQKSVVPLCVPQEK